MQRQRLVSIADKSEIWISYSSREQRKSPEKIHTNNILAVI